ncbi:hypothetical protein I6I06_05825 [Paraburkholderia ginsengisoli]|uniref:Uncharacterized protein n=1 Tax=Paraburkholderia ginsengisoli TaxID=311231 RepID=A0A7T4N4A1_9BURK|nr:hypothetical protein I6I06_05825 [Paraburkholderia ginsengisoli]
MEEAWQKPGVYETGLSVGEAMPRPQSSGRSRHHQPEGRLMENAISSAEV